MARGVPALANRSERFDATFHALTLRQFADAVVGSDTPDAPSRGDPHETMLMRDGTDHPLKEEEEEEEKEEEEDEDEDEAFEELFYGRALGFRVHLDAASSTLVVDRVMDPALEGRVRVGDRVFTVNGVPMGAVQRRHALQAKLATMPGRPVKIGFLRACVAAAAVQNEGRDGGDGVGGDAGGAEEAKGSEAYDYSSNDLKNNRDNTNNRQSQLIDTKNHNTTSPRRSRANRNGSYSGYQREVSRSPTTAATPSKSLPQEEEDVNTSTAGPTPVAAAAASSNSAAAFELACDACNQWFLNTEVGVSIQVTEAMDGWFCRNCRPEAAPPVHKSGNAMVSPKFSARKFFAKTSSAAAWRQTTPTKGPVATKAKTSGARAAPPLADSSVSDDGFDDRNNFAAEIATSPIRSPSRQRSNNHSLVSTPPRGRRSLPPLSPLSPKVGTGDGGGSVVSSVDGSEPAAAAERDREDPTPQLGQMPPDEGSTQPLQSTQRSPAWFRGNIFSAARPQSAGALRPASAPAAEPQTAIVAARPQTAMAAANSSVENRSLAVPGRRPSTAAAQGAPVESSALVEFEALQRSQAEAMLQHAHYAQQARTHNLKSPLAHMTKFAPLSPGVSSQPFPRDFVLNFGDSTPGAAARSSSSFNPGMVVDQNSGVVLSVSPGGAADRANIRAGFTILEVGGVAVNSAEEVSDALFYFRRRSKVEKHGHAEPTVALLCIPGDARLPDQLAAASTGKAGAAPEEVEPLQISQNTSAKQLAAVNQASPYARLAGALSAKPTPGPGRKGARAWGNPPQDRQRNSRRY